MSGATMYSVGETRFEFCKCTGYPMDNVHPAKLEVQHLVCIFLPCAGCEGNLCCSMAGVCAASD